MVYIKIGNQYADGCFNHLEIFLKIIDTELSIINHKIKKSFDPDTDGLFDLGEYLIGYGFVAIQRYIESTYPQTILNKKNIYKLGHKINNNTYLIEAINSGANYWKHEPEWPLDIQCAQTIKNSITPISINRTGSNLSGHQKKTFDSISKVTSYDDYTLSTLLAEILKSFQCEEELSFLPILPLVEGWRKKLDELHQQEKSKIHP